ncbi:hypothetical protein Phi19:3_gp051 [Cellulophaga phage phi19:3]|uniref:Uncharacterized protein n=1 Tax=Cellulophaga phage phi19:3 TaxID=1327971 RepID=R9ZY59_9CAUD|nr:hypothetical protein Phi19:3_gp051 [Cellulophaga phage phi19:3]AGO47455.1 hypothetical protein Phi19:3_gp051 [Cellulophaga phage phi19:3]
MEKELKENNDLLNALYGFDKKYNLKGINRTDLNNTIDIVRLKIIELNKLKDTIMNSIIGSYKGIDYEITNEDGMTDMNGNMPFKYNIEGDEQIIYSTSIEKVYEIVKDEIEEEYLD